MTGWHHHGDNLTLGYVLSGAFHLEHGPGGRESIDIHAGEYFSVAGGTVHREGTVDAVPCSVVAVRVGEGPPYLVAMDGPEPGSASEASIGKSGISIPHPARTPKGGEANAENIDRDGSEAAQTPPDRGLLGHPRQVHRTPRFAGAHPDSGSGAVER